MPKTMSMKDKIKKPTRAALIALWAITLTLAVINSVSAQGNGHTKKSEKLNKKMLQVQPSDYVDVIVSPTSAWTSGLTNDLNGRGASLKKAFANYGFKVYRIKQQDINGRQSGFHWRRPNG